MRALIVSVILISCFACSGSPTNGDPSDLRRCDAGTGARRCGRLRDAGVHDASAPVADAGSTRLDAGPTPIDAGPPRIDAGPVTPCVRARRLWFDDFETGDYRRWTGMSYGDGWGNGCESNGFSSITRHSGALSNRSEIVCASDTDVHRGYGGLQFSGDTVLPSYTNTGVGTEAPNGMVSTFWFYLDVPYDFGGGRWLSLWTTNGDCAWIERVITLGLEDAGRRLTPAHIWDTGGTVTFSPNAPSVPLRQWVRVTVYINYYSGQMHVWQNGTSVVHASFTRPSTDICQWHWGAYASGNNTSLVLFEDDKSVWKLEQPWTDFSREPHFDGTGLACP